MAKFLIQGTYTGEGLHGLQKDTARDREAVFRKAVESLGGKLECLYLSLGEYDVVAIVDMPDTVAVVAVAFTSSATGLVHSKTTALLTMEEADRAIHMRVNYVPLGKAPHVTAKAKPAKKARAK